MLNLMRYRPRAFLKAASRAAGPFVSLDWAGFAIFGSAILLVIGLRMAGTFTALLRAAIVLVDPFLPVGLRGVLAIRWHPP